MTYDQIVKLLRENKKLRIRGLNYDYGVTPVVKVIGEHQETDCIELECVPDLSYDFYFVEKSIPMLESIKVEKYIKGNSVPISYIYTHPSNNHRLKAHLQNGEDVDYSLSIFDLDYVVGEYIPEETQAVSVKLWFFKSDSQRLHSETLTTYKGEKFTTAEDIVNYIRDTEWKFPGANIVVQFPNKDWEPIIIEGKTRRYSGNK